MDLTFKKNNLNINLYIKPVFEDNEIYYSIGNKIIAYDYTSRSVSDKFSFKNKKISKFLKIANFLYVLSIEGNLYEYDINTKLVSKTFVNNDKTLALSYSKFLDSLILINPGKILIVNRDTFVVTKQKEITTGQFNYLSILEIDSEGKSLITNLKNRVLFINLLNLDIQIVDFVKNISSGIFLDSSTYVVGDTVGKLHFLTLSEDRKVTLTLNH
jgi:hypothetical protein